MGTSARTLPDVSREHVDRINQALAAGDDAQAFYLAYEYFRARVKKLGESKDKKRRLDADGFRRQGAYLLAGLAGETALSRPADEFRSGSPLIPGGDWRP
jgi:hypothetical protein